MNASLRLSLCLALLLCLTISAAGEGWPKLVLQTGHVDSIDIVSFSPDGRYIASGGSTAHLIILWDVASGRQLRSFVNPRNGLAVEGPTSMVFSPPDSKYLASGKSDGSVVLWDVTTGKELWSFKSDTYGSVSVAFSPDGKVLAKAGQYETLADGDYAVINLFESSTGKPANSFKVLINKHVRSGVSDGLDLSKGPDGAAFSPDGRVLAIGIGDGKIRLLDVATGKQIRVLEGCSGGFSFSRTGNLLAAGSQDGKNVKVWDLTSDRAPRILGEFEVTKNNDPSLGAVVLSPDGTKLVIGNFSKIKLLDVATGKTLRSFEGSDRLAAFSPDGGLLASGDPSKSGAINLWDVESGEVVRSFTSLVQELRSMTASPEGKILVNTGTAGVRLWDLAGGAQRVFGQGVNEGSIGAVAFSPDGKQLAIGGYLPFISFLESRGLALWDLKSKQPTTSFEAGANGEVSGELEHINNIAYSPDGKTLATISDKEAGPIGGNASVRVNLWDTSTGALLHSIEAHPKPKRNAGRRSRNAASRERRTETAPPVEDDEVELEGARAITFSPNSKTLASGGGNEEIKLWDVRTGRQLPRKFERSATPNFLTFSPDGRLLVAGSGGGLFPGLENLGGLADTLGGAVLEVALQRAKMSEADKERIRQALKERPAWEPEPKLKIWDAATGALRYSFEKDIAGVTAAAFSQDSKVLATGGDDWQVKLWDMTNGQPLAKLGGHDSGVTALAFSPNGKILISASSNDIRLWDVTGHRELATLVLLNEKDWVVTTPDGLFDGSPAAWQSVLWRFSDNISDVEPVEAYFNEFFRPGLLAELFGGDRPVAPAKILEKDRRKPKLKLSLNGTSSEAIAERSVTVNVEVFDAPAGARDIRLFRNGALVKTWDGDVLGDKKNVTLKATVSIVEGENRLTAYGFNRDDVKSPDAPLDLTGAQGLQRRARTTHILAVGINEYADNPFFKDLSYAERDAKTISDDLAERQKAAGQQVNILPALYSQRATKEKILAALKTLAANVEPEDSVIVYFSGHGKATTDGHFYLIPHDVGYKSRPEVFQHSISEADLKEAFRPLDAGQILLIIDACNSGQAMESKDEWRRGPMNSKGLAQFAYEKGMYLLAASQGYQAAVEIEELRGGLLTSVLVNEGFTASADDDPLDGRITSKEWLDYAVQAVPRKQSEMIEQAQKKGTKVSFSDTPKGDATPGQNFRQTPRAFYRRETEVDTFVIALLAAGQ